MKNRTPHPFRFHQAALIGIVAALALSVTGHAEEIGTPSRPLKIMTVGNSFAKDATDLLPEMARGAGKEIIVGRIHLGGCPLSLHAKNIELDKQAPGTPEARPYQKFYTPARPGVKEMISLREFLKSEPWDIVTIQQASPVSDQPRTYEPHAGVIVERIKQSTPEAKIVVHETWAYREDYEGFVNGKSSQAKMYAGLKDAYHALAARYGCEILPVGDAFQIARGTDRWRYTTDPNFDFANPAPGTLPDQSKSLNTGWGWTKDSAGNTKLALDFKHCNVAGKYLAAAVWLESFFPGSVEKTTFVPKGLDAEAAADLRRIAIEAVTQERAREKKSS